MSFQPSDHLSRRVAASLGEQQGRSVSRVLGDGLTSAAYGKLTPDRAVDIVHTAMAAAAVFAAVASAKRKRVAKWALPAFAILWTLGRAKHRPG